ncbi:hypothetical protein B296_00013558, partial [Ensete ventricosum]
CCGYNLKKSVEELLMISSNTLEKGKAVGYDDMRKSAGKGSKMEKFPYEDCYPNSLSSVRFYFSPRPIPVYGRSCMIPGAWGVLMYVMPLCWLACTKEKRGMYKHTNLCADTPILLHVRGSTIIKRLEKQMKNLLQCWLNQGCFMFYLFWLYNLDFLSVIALRYLKLVIGADGEDRKQGKKRRLVLKLLENESIKWTESEDNPGTIYIQLDQVNPKKLSFAKK